MSAPSETAAGTGAETAAPGGKVVTFYSYKGGTGRSMTLANVAWILASNGKRVLAIDWDVEAPGLHRYFAPFLLDPDLTATPGLMDLLVDFATETVCGSTDAEAPRDWYREYANRVLRYVVSLEWGFAGKGTLDLLPAGRQGPQYAPLVNGFNWQHFYEEQGGGVFIDAVKERLRALYDYVLVDSRTGVSDTAGICTVQLPDTLVACFTLNNQGIEGAAAVASSAFQQRQGDGGLRVLPVPMRIENAENTKLQARWEVAKRRLAPFPMLRGVERDRYWTEVAVTYKPFYAYEEILATFGDRPTDPIPLLPSAERLAHYITDGDVQKLVPPDEKKRVEVLGRYAGAPTPAPEEASAEEDAAAEAVFARLSPKEQDEARRLFTRLVEVLSLQEGDTRPARVQLDSLRKPTRGVAAAFVAAGLLSSWSDEATGKEMVGLVQESLPERWQRFQRWIESDRDFLFWRTRFSKAAAEWHAGGPRERLTLLRNPMLRAGRIWLDFREKDFTPVEVEYVRAGRRAASAARGLGVLAFVLLFLLVDVALLDGRWTGIGRTVVTPPPPDTASVSVSELVADANRLSDQGVYEQALALLDSAVRIDSASAEAYVSRGNTRLRMGDSSRAADDFDRAVQLDPRAPDGYVGRANVQLASLDTAGAVTTLRTAYALVDSSGQRGALTRRLQELGSRPVDRSIVVMGYSGSRSDATWLRRIGEELDRAGYPLSGPWTPARNTTAQVRYFRDSRREVADSVAAAVNRSLERQRIPVRVRAVQVDSAAYRAPPGSVTIWLPPMEPARPERTATSP